MQDSQLLPPKEKSPTTHWWRLAKWIVTLLIVSYVFRFFHKPENDLFEVLPLLRSTFRGENSLALLVLLLLVPANWALESLKWQYLAQKAVPLTFAEAFRSTLTGLAVGVAVPAQLGDTVGRITSLRSQRRLRTLGAALISNGIQFYVSVIGGAICWFWRGKSLDFSQEVAWAISSLLLFILAGGLLLGIYRQRLLDWRSNRPWAKKLKKNLSVAQRYSSGDLLFALSVGMARYLVFVFQYVLALGIFDLSISGLDILAGVGLIYLVKTLLPAINAIGDLGIRQFTALYVFAPYHVATEKIVAATFLIWLLNILVPLLVGVYFIWKFKWSAKYA